MYNGAGKGEGGATLSERLETQRLTAVGHRHVFDLQIERRSTMAFTGVASPIESLIGTRYADPAGVTSRAMVTLFGLAAAGLIFLALLAFQMVKLPPSMAAADREEIGRLGAIVNAPKPALGPIRIKIDDLAERADEFFDDQERELLPLYNLQDKARDLIQRVLIKPWVESFDELCKESRIANANALHFFKRTSTWLHKCAGEISENDLLPVFDSASNR